MRGPAPVAVALLAAALAVGGTGTPARAQGPQAPAGAERLAREARDFDSYALPVGRFGAGRAPVRAVEGAVDRAAWRLADPRASVAGIIRDYRERLGAQGFEPLWECSGDACGGFDFRFGAEIMPPPAMLVDVRDFAQLSTRRAEPEAFVSILASRVLDTIRIQTVTVAPGGRAPVLDPPAAPQPPEPAEPANVPEPDPPSAPGLAAGPAPAPGPTSAPEQPSAADAQPDEDTLLAALRRDGHVPVPGLDFETGGVRLSPGSAGALDALARLLRADKELRVLIVGHSDDEGPLDLNIDLSRRRAESVMQALRERGVPAGQLEARGAGFLSPVATNATEEGRAANRRVELVLR